MVSIALSVAPLSSANNINNSSVICMNNAKVELSGVLQSNSVKESVVVVDSDVVVDAVLKYFDEDVKKFRLSLKAKNEIKSILSSYFSSHSLFVVSNSGKVEFLIDDKKEFSLMVKKIINIVIEDMPFLVKNVVIPLFLWSNSSIQRKLDNLDSTVFNMKEKQYKEIVFDCMAWITKKVCNSMDWSTTLGEYYKSFSKYFPNKNWNHVLQEINASGQSNLDIRKFKYKK